MKRLALSLATLLLVANVALAQLPKFDTTPGKWSYSTRTEIPGMGSIPMSFEQCVSQKDIDEGKNLSGQKDAGISHGGLAMRPGKPVSASGAVNVL